MGHQAFCFLLLTRSQQASDQSEQLTLCRYRGVKIILGGSFAAITATEYTLMWFIRFVRSKPFWLQGWGLQEGSPPTAHTKCTFLLWPKDVPFHTQSPRSCHSCLPKQGDLSLCRGESLYTVQAVSSAQIQFRASIFYLLHLAWMGWGGEQWGAHGGWGWPKFRSGSTCCPPPPFWPLSEDFLHWSSSNLSCLFITL